MDEKQKRQRPMVNAATVEKCKNLKFLGYFLNATGATLELVPEVRGKIVRMMPYFTVISPEDIESDRLWFLKQD